MPVLLLQRSSLWERQVVTEGRKWKRCGLGATQEEWKVREGVAEVFLIKTYRNLLVILKSLGDLMAERPFQSCAEVSSAPFMNITHADVD